MKIIEKTKEDEGNWPNYVLENGWRVVRETYRNDHFSYFYGLWIGDSKAEVIRRYPNGKWCLFPDFGLRFSCRKDAVAEWVAQRMSQ
jgi:hypothetical protein